MKTIYNLLIILGFANLLQAQNIPANTTRPVAVPVAAPAPYTNMVVNYVRTWAPSMPTTDSATVVSGSRTVTEVKQHTEYFDGLGRPLQTVDKGVSPGGRDLVTPFVYDALNREPFTYLPYVPKTGNYNDGRFKTTPFITQRVFYRDSTMVAGVGADSIYYTQTTFESSPLNRPLQTWAPGNGWAREGGDHPITRQYLVNTVADSVSIWTLSGGLPVSTQFYAAGDLIKDVTIDEAGVQTISFTDKDGHLILKKVQLAATPGTAHMGWLCTYSVYDNLWLLRFVIPPKAVDAVKGSWSISAALAGELCFIYRYDDLRRMIIRKVPGADSTEMVYDRRDRLVLIRDGVLKQMLMWTGTLYDSLNRVRQTVLFYHANTRAQMEAAVKAAAFDPANTLSFIDAGTFIPLQYTYYDNYSYPGVQPYLNTDLTKPQAGANPYAEALPAVASTLTKGLVTGKREYIQATGQWLTTSIYYNDKGRVIQTTQDNMPGGKDITYTLYDFSGKVLSTYLKHTNPRAALTPQTTILTTIDYDAMGRIDSIKKRINDNPALQHTIAVNTYDELGQLKTKRLDVTGPSTQLETLNYEYNIRGWLKSINKNFVNTAGSTANWFGQDISYEYGFDSTEYNGNISGIKWKSGSNGIARAYGFDYDKTSRILSGYFTQQNLGSTIWTNTKADFSLSGMSYDPNGNIQSMKQMGLNGVTIQTIDSLKYGYNTSSNKLSFVTDKKNDPLSKLGDFKEPVNTETQDYWYDTNGNMAKDKNKGIDSIYYNYQNLPVIIFMKGNKAVIQYLYNAAGEKLVKFVSDTSVQPNRFTATHYVSGMQYKLDTLQFISHEEGRIRPVYKTGQPVSFVYDYFIKDHLGNIREVLTTKSDTAQYVATMETAASGVENALFSNIDNTRTAKPAGYPTDNTTNPNAYVAKLNAVNGQKIGPSLVLRVMAGDSIQIAVKALYKNTGANTSGTTSASMVTALLQAFSGAGISEGIHNATGSGSPIYSFTNGNYDQLKTKDANQNLPDKPKAYLNFALFDDQFNMVDENSGVKQVQGIPDSLSILALTRTPIKKTGFLYIYTSNESAQDVFFDNLIVTHNSGPLLEETHYYPFGLTMAGISSSALKGTAYPENKIKYNGKELQSEEFVDGSGLEWYDFGARMYDPQIGRWHVPDAMASKFEWLTPYNYTGNTPLNNVDPDGNYFFGLFGSTSEQRSAARTFAEMTGGELRDITRKSIHVNYNSASPGRSEDGTGLVDVVNSNQYFRTNGRIETGTITGNNAIDQIYDKIESGQLAPGPNGELVASKASGRAEYIAAESILVPIPAIGKIAQLIKGGAVLRDAAATVETGIQANRIAGNAFRDEIASLLRAEGREVMTEVYKKTPFGRRFIDIEVSQNGKVLGGIETKVGSSRYHTLQRLKDLYLEKVEGYPVNLVRKP